MESQNIRIRLKAFDHRLLDQSTREIVNTLKGEHYGKSDYIWNV